MSARLDRWAVHHREYGWLIDSCAGGAWSGPVHGLTDAQVDGIAKTWTSGADAYAELDACDIPRECCEAVLLVF